MNQTLDVLMNTIAYRRTQTINCNIHGNNMRVCLNGKCEQCVLLERLEIEEKQNSERLLKLLTENNVKGDYINASFNNYILNSQDNLNLQTRCFEIIKRYANNKKYIFDKGHGLTLLGNTGSGKTHLAISVLRELLNAGYSGLFIKYYEINNKNYDHKFKDLLKKQLLIIDEVGISPTDVRHHTLHQIIDQRYESKLPTILISNLKVDEFENLLDAPFISRLYERSTRIVFNWEDYRLRVK